jgi:hypothetical protein
MLKIPLAPNTKYDQNRIKLLIIINIIVFIILKIDNKNVIL